MSGTPIELTTPLLALTNLMRKVYHPDFNTAHPRWQGAMNKLISMSRRRINGDGITIQALVRMAYPSVMSMDINASYPDPQSMAGGSYTVNLSNDANANNFGKHMASASVTTLDLTRVTGSSDASAIPDFVSKTIEQITGDVGESRAIHQYLDTTGLLALVNGTAVNTDSEFYSECSAVTTTGGARFKVDTGSIAYLMPGRKLDVYVGSGAGVAKRITNGVQVMGYNPADGTVAVYGLDADGNPSSTIDISSIADNDGLYIKGEKDQCPVTLGKWMSRVSGTTADTIFGVNRKTPGNQFMSPYFAGPSTARTLQLGDMDQAAIMAGYLTEANDSDGMVLLGRPELVQTAQNLIGKDTVIPFPTREQKGEMLAEYGFEGAIFRNGRFGRVVLVPDPMMIDNTIWLLRPGNFEILHAYAEKWRWQPGDGGSGFWYRTNDPSNNGSRTGIYRADGDSLQATICTKATDNLVIRNVQPSVTLPAA